MTMRHLGLALVVLFTLTSPGASRAGEPTRFTPLKPDELTPAQKEWADAISVPPRNAKFTNPPYRAYIRNPELAPRLSAMSDYLRWNSSLPARLSELAILITARQWTAQYEWFAHYPLAMKAGLDPQVARDIANGVRPQAMKDDEAALYDLAMALYRDKNVPDNIYNAAVDKLGEKGVVEAISVMGYYDLVSMTLIAARAVPADNGAPLLQPLPK
jgi:4-carboxymuconolactone decarboxylase